MKTNTTFHLRRRRPLAVLWAGFFLALAPLAMRAATIVWEGDTSTQFSTGANWTGGTAPANSINTDIGSFQTGTIINNPNLTANRSINGLVFVSGTAAWTFSGSGGTRILRLGDSGIVSNDDSTQTFNNASLGIALGANAAFTSNSTGALSFGGTLASFNLSTFTLTLNGSSTNASNAIGEVIAGTGGITKSGAGLWTLSGTNTYTGVTTINAGTLSVATIGNGGVAGNLGQATTAAGNVVLGGGSLQYTGATASTNRNYTLTAGTTSTIDVSTGATNLTISGASTNTTGGLTKAGAGTLTLSGANLYTGTTTVSAGTLAYGASNALSSGNVTVSGGTLAMGAFSDTVGVVSLTSGSITGSTGVLTGTSYDMQSGTVSAILGGTGAMTKTTAGTVTLSGANTFTGAITVNAGVLSISNKNQLGAVGATADLTLNGGTLRISGADVIVNVGDTGRSMALGASGGTIDTVNNFTWDRNITGTGTTLNKTGAGTFTMLDPASFTGTFNINQGTVLFDGGNDRLADTVAVNIASGATLNVNTRSDTIGSLAGAGNLTNANAAATAATLTFGGLNTNTTFSGIITDTTGNLNLVKAGTGETIFSGANSYDGTTTISAGTLNIQHATGLGTTTGGTTVSATGAALELEHVTGIAVGAETLSLSGTGVSNNGALRSVSGTNSFAGNITLAAAAEIQSDAGTLTLTGGINAASTQNLTLDGAGNIAASGAIGANIGTVTKNGTGTTTLSGTNTYTGTTTVNAGTLMAQGSASLGNTSGNVTVTAGTLALAGGAPITTLNPTNAETITKSGTLSLSGSGATASTGALHAAGSTGQTSQWIGNLTLGGNATISAADNLLIIGNGSYTNTMSLGSNTLTFNTTSATGVTPTYLPAPSFILDPTNIFFNSSISGSGGLVKNGAGTVTIISYPSNSFTGSTVINDGKLIVGGPNNLPVISSSSITVGDGSGTAESAVLQMGFLASGQAAKNYQIGGTSGTPASASNATTSMTVNSDGLFNLNGGNNSLINLTLQGGQVDMGAAYSSLLTITGGIASDMSAQTALIKNGNLGMSSNTFAIDVENGAAAIDLQIDSIVQNGIGYTGGSAGTSLTKTNTGTLVFTGTNTYTGVTDIQGGILNIQNSAALGQGGASAANGTVVQSGAQLQLDGGGGSLTIANESLTLNGAGVSTTGALLNALGDNTYNGFITLNSDSRINANAGTLLTIANTGGAGATIINGDAAGRALTVGGAGDTEINSVVGTNIGTIVKDGTGTATLAGQYSANSITTVNDGTLVLNMTNGLTGASSPTVTIGDSSGAANSATLRLGQSNQIVNSAAVTVNSDGRFDVNGKTETVGSIAGSGNIDLGSGGQLFAGGNDTSTAFSGTLLGDSTSLFTKNGIGVLTINSDLGFNGDVDFNAGTMVFNVDNLFDDTNSTFNIAAGTTLRLSNADLTITNLNFTGTGSITLDFSGSASSLNVTNLTLAAGVTINIINWADATDYFFATNWAGAVQDTTGSSPMNQIIFNSPTWVGNNTKWQGYDDQITPVPEPSTYGALLVGAMGALLGFRRYRRTKTAVKAAA